MMMPTTMNLDMDHQDPHMNTKRRSMIDVSAHYTFSAFKVPPEYSLDLLLKHAQSGKIQGFQTICEDRADGSRWIIVNSDEYKEYSALGLFTFGVHQMEFDMVDMVTFIRLNKNELVQTKGFGTLCFDSYLYTNGGYWVICKMPIDYNEGSSLNALVTIPIDPQVLELDGEFCQVSRLPKFPAETNLHESGDGTDHLVSSEFEGLTSPVDVNGLETPNGDDVVVVKRSCICTGDSFCEECFRIVQTHEQVTSDDNTRNMLGVEPHELDSGSSSSDPSWKIALGQSSSPNFVQWHASTSQHNFRAPSIMVTNLIEDLPISMFDNSLETMQFAVKQGSSGEIFHCEETIKAPSRHREMECHVPNAPVTTTSKNPRKRKAPQPKANKHHGVIKRQGGRKSFVAYFRPKDLPETNKKFVTVGEFKNESDAWEAFNLFAMVHEGKESCMNIKDEDKESLEIEVEVYGWRELPRVDLLAFLRQKGRDFFKVLDLQDIKIPKYRNVKFHKNKSGKHKGKIRWFCDVMVEKGMIEDPKVVDIIKSTSTFDTAEEAARKADKLMILKEGYMAWTNFTITDYLTEAQKEKWDKLWIPLDDNPKKYLSTDKY